MYEKDMNILIKVISDELIPALFPAIFLVVVAAVTVFIVFAVTMSSAQKRTHEMISEIRQRDSYTYGHQSLKDKTDNMCSRVTNIEIIVAELTKKKLREAKPKKKEKR